MNGVSPAPTGDLLFDDEQNRRRALALESFIVEAPAGAGKTELLTQRYLRLLATVESPEEIIAITFTNKAAGEMRSRIQDSLALAHAGIAPTVTHKLITFELARAALARSAELDWNLLTQTGRMRLTTIDALCSSLARQMPFLSRFGAQPATIEDASRHYADAARRALDHVIWMVPHYSRGVAAHRKFAVRLFGWLLIGLPAFFFSMIFAFVLFDSSPTEVGFIMFMGAIGLANAVIAALYFPLRFYRQWLPIARQAEEIFAALGYPDPSQVDLPRDHKRYCKANGIKWPYLTDGPWIYHYLDPR